MSDPVFVYLSYGPSPATARELRYSLETLRREVEDARVAVFTDTPDRFSDLSVDLVDISGDLGEIFGAFNYRHRAKPATLARALRQYRQACVLLDTDSFVRPGFALAVRDALAAGAAMNHFVRDDPYPDFGPFRTELPILGPYELDRAKSRMLNSGLVAARAEHLPLIEDAVALIERLWKGGLTRHDIEQFAIAEAFRLGGVPVRLIDREFVHYCARWSRRFMRRRLRTRAPGEKLAYSKVRVRWFKWVWQLRLGWRHALRHPPYCARRLKARMMG